MLFLLAFFISGSVSAQESRAQLLKKLEDASLHDTVKVNTCILLVNSYMSTDVDSAHIMAEKALALSEKAGWAKGICISYLKIGIICQNTGKYPEANRYFFKGLKYAEELNNNAYKFQVFNSIANAFSYQRMFDQALIYYDKALESAKAGGYQSMTGVTLMNMGSVAYNLGYDKRDFSKSYEYFGEALKIAEADKDSNLMTSIYGNFALAYTDDKRYNEALVMIDKALALSSSLGAEEDFIFLNYYAGRAYAHMKEYDKAILHFNESIKYCWRFDSKDYRSENYLCMAEMYNDRKDYRNAYIFMEKHKLLEDSLLNDETTNQLNELKTVYETEKKEQALALSNLKLQAQDSKLRIIVISSVIGGALLLLLLFFIFNRYQLKQKANRKLESAYGIIEEKQKDITDSINYAQKIQYAILPDEEEIRNAFTDSFVFFRPRDVVSGDFYWFHVEQGRAAAAVEADDKTINDLRKANEQLVMIAAADCTGHGVPGALMSMIGSSLLNQIVLEGGVSSTGEVLDLLRQGIQSAFRQKPGENRRRDGMDIGLLAFSKGKVQFSGANNGVYIVRNGVISELKPDKQPVGQHEGEEKPFTTLEMETQAGDCFYLYTDGFADQFGGEKGKKFKYAKLKELLQEMSPKPMAEQKAQIEQAFADWKGAQAQVDDVLVIGIRI